MIKAWSLYLPPLIDKKKLTQRFFPFVFCCEFTIESPAYFDVSFFIKKKTKNKTKNLHGCLPTFSIAIKKNQINKFLKIRYWKINNENSWSDLGSKSLRWHTTSIEKPKFQRLVLKKKKIKTKITKFLRLKTNSFCMCSLVSQASVDYSTNTPHKYDPRFRGPQYTHWQCASPASLRRTSLSLSFSLCLKLFFFLSRTFFPSVSAGLFFCCCCSACDRFFF